MLFKVKSRYCTNKKIYNNTSLMEVELNIIKQMPMICDNDYQRCIIIIIIIKYYQMSFSFWNLTGLTVPSGRHWSTTFSL